MTVFNSEIRVLHYSPSPNSFFTGGCGYQIRARIFKLFGVKIYTQELDRETVPHWHYVQQRTLGCSEWRSRLLAEAKEKTDATKM